MQAIVTIGTFDGVHLGHQALLRRTAERARGRGLISLALTFPKPPQNYLGRPKPLLLPLEKKIALLKRYVDRVVVIDFREIRSLDPRGFVVRVLRERLQAAGLVVGENFRFGRDRSGTAAMLCNLGRELGIDVEVIPRVVIRGEPVSSTAVREALRAGDAQRAAELLGRPHALWGLVVRGAGQGRALGFPTANLRIDAEILVPAEGIYAAWVRHLGGEGPGAFYVGRRPTLDGGRLSLEVYLLDAQIETDLYGMELEIELRARIRGDRRFETLEELRRQIRADVEAVRALFARRG
jgi:riboflavin kinase/FMN adenylyltransferase